MNQSQELTIGKLPRLAIDQAEKWVIYQGRKLVENARTEMDDERLQTTA